MSFAQEWSWYIQKSIGLSYSNIKESNLKIRSGFLLAVLPGTIKNLSLRKNKMHLIIFSVLTWLGSSKHEYFSQSFYVV